MSATSRRRSLAPLLLVLGLLGGACGGGDDGAASTSGSSTAGGAGAGKAGDGGAADGSRPAGGPEAAATVQLGPSQFDPAKVTVKVGETVRWVWGGGVQHDVAGGSFKSPVKSKGDFSHTFTTAGTFPFKCDIHPTMKGSVTVEP